MATKLRIDWPANPASENVTHYEVWKTENGGPATLAATVTQLFYEIAAPAPVVYGFFIKAKNYVGTSGASATVTAADVPTTPGQPTLTFINT